MAPVAMPRGFNRWQPTSPGALAFQQARRYHLVNRIVLGQQNLRLGRRRAPLRVPVTALPQGLFAGLQPSKSVGAAPMDHRLDW